MNRHLYLCRHGETLWNLERRIQGRTDIELSDVGRAQAAELAAFFALNKPKADIVVSSPMKRAHETAKCVAEKLGLECIVDEDLTEIDTGDFTGCCMNTLQDDPIWQAHLEDPWAVGYGPTGEPAEAVRTRVMRAVQKYDRAILVTHASPIRHILLALFDIPGAHLYDIHVENASATYIMIRQNGPKLMYVNAVQHLSNKNNRSYQTCI